MLGPLPTLYRLVVFACAVLACVGAGVWLAQATPVLPPNGSGVVVGVALGLACATALVHTRQDRPRKRGRTS